jgi:hypothetical protein
MHMCEAIVYVQTAYTMLPNCLRGFGCCVDVPCRYAVVYRLLHGVLVIVVSRSHANVFANLNLVAAVSRLLVAELKSVEITPERLVKKYAQVSCGVYLCAWMLHARQVGQQKAVAHILAHGLCVPAKWASRPSSDWHGAGYGLLRMFVVLNCSAAAICARGLGARGRGCAAVEPAHASWRPPSGTVVEGGQLGHTAHALNRGVHTQPTIVVITALSACCARERVNCLLLRWST